MFKGKNNFLLLLVLFLAVSYPYAQEKKPPAIPPAVVVVSEVKTGAVAPEIEFVGTVYYPEVSDVAAESAGRIETIHFEEGHRVKKGDLLVKVNSDLLEKTIQSTVASHEEALANLEKARADLTRIENLYEKKVVPRQLYDEDRFRVLGLEKKAASLLAEVQRLRIELSRKSVRAPFEGVVLKRLVDRGEWLQPGSAVATVARDDMVDILVEVPESILRSLRIGMEVNIRAGGKETRGKIFAFIPKGDIPTRTLPVKIRMNNTFSLVEGIEARVRLPSMESRKGLMVPRDAVIMLSGKNVVFAVIDSETRMIPVNVTGYQGQMAGIEGEGLSAGMKVVVKGNERLRDGQPVTIFATK